MTTASSATESASSSKPVDLTPDWLLIRVTLATNQDCCGGCPRFIERWRRFWDEHASPSAPPVAIMICRDYYGQLRKKSQAMIRQANRRYQFAEFDIGEQAAQVQAVNFSHPNTSEGPTRGWMIHPVDPNDLPDRIMGLCGTIHQDRWFGGFDHDGIMRGYLRLIRMDTLGVIHSFFRHGEDSTGVMNGLLAHIAEHAGVRYVSYHTIDALPDSGRPAFKRRTGFQPARLTITT